VRVPQADAVDTTASSMLLEPSPLCLGEVVRNVIGVTSMTAGSRP